MWLGIIALLDKIFGVIGQLTGFFIKRSDASEIIKREQQAVMDKAEKEGDFDAWKTARSKRNRS